MAHWDGYIFPADHNPLGIEEDASGDSYTSSYCLMERLVVILLVSRRMLQVLNLVNQLVAPYESCNPLGIEEDASGYATTCSGSTRNFVL